MSLTSLSIKAGASRFATNRVRGPVAGSSRLKFSWITASLVYWAGISAVPAPASNVDAITMAAMNHFARQRRESV